MKIALALVLTLATQSASPVTVEQLTSPEKALRLEVTVPAALDEVWAAFSTKEGLQTWLWKDARVDLRPGGDWIAQFASTATAARS